MDQVRPGRLSGGIPFVISEGRLQPEYLFVFGRTYSDNTIFSFLYAAFRPVTKGM
ncbi:MAG: hypothetical protein HQK57_09300 [Deltaproteobacteria bacterium]|nr:hypothetical protein [Deltaproteobacteria bacterium]